MNIYILYLFNGDHNSLYEETILACKDLNIIEDRKKDLNYKIDLIKKYKNKFTVKNKLKLSYLNLFFDKYNFSDKERKLFKNYIENQHTKLYSFYEEIELIE